MTFFAIPKPEPKSLYQVVMDHRERPSGIHHILNDWGVATRIETLEIADYIISNDVACERKEGKDFYSSLFGSKQEGSRLFQQAINISGAYKQPVWIVEGSIPSRPDTINSLLGALITLSFNYGMHLFFSSNVAETARIIRLLCKREQDEKRGRIHIHRPKKPKKSIRDMQLYLVSSFRGWSGELAQRALLHSKTPRNLFSYNEEKLCEIEGISKGRSKQFTKVLDTKYKKKVNKNRKKGNENENKNK